MRQVITRMLQQDPEITVVGVARDGMDALAKLERLSPDVLTLDLEMPKMDGLEFLARVMQRHPLPIVVVSSWATAGAEKTLHALELGAVDFVTKPVAFPSEAMFDIAEELIGKVKTAALA
ncbi:MAG: response regulator, partial [Firmicutes bacterium]|nr:response regulator [Bacillota bacterium]